MSRAAMSVILIGLLAVSFKTGAYSQPQSTQPQGTQPQSTQLGSPGNAGSATANAERDKIWNSSTMLHARAWVQEYCARSAKITPAEGKKYMTELANLSPTQMKLWLLRFQHEEEQIKQHQAAFNQARHAAVQGALGIQQQTRQDYANINRDTNEAAKAEEGVVKEQRQFGQQMFKQNQAESAQTYRDNLTNPLGSYGYGGYGWPGGASYHVHVHSHR